MNESNSSASFIVPEVGVSGGKLAGTGVVLAGILSAVTGWFAATLTRMFVVLS